MWVISNGYVADDLGWPVSTLNHLNFYIFHCLMQLHNWRLQRLQIWCKGWMCKSQLTPMEQPSLIGSWSGYMTHPLQNFGDFNHITGTAEPNVVKLCTSRLYQFWQQDDISPTKWACCGYVSFVVMQRVARVCQRQMSYWLILMCKCVRLHIARHGTVAHGTLHIRFFDSKSEDMMLYECDLVYAYQTLAL